MNNKKTIQELRKAKRLTQKQLADELGFNIRTIKGWETKTRAISRANKKYLSLYFKVDEKYIDF